ncbi:unnamed protein product [Adineta ricciae]|uniref:G-protein coupled receptors family 1 profile domain-containing protein n=1 Tax=Adineta ricciae TaxID=249248 RepID=A0A815MM74_ADIRI|nr:unnamed protein product [Adineta ricciae]CAF1426616.1 unnamed protein product [Adineta ricciae]
MSSHCLDGGQLILNQTLNTFFCLCDPCYHGINCSELIPRKQQIQFDENLHDLIISLIILCLSLLNNPLTIHVCLKSVRIRRTNIGVYLIIYCVICIIGTIILTIDHFIQYFKPFYSSNDEELYETLHCLLERIGGHVTIFICLWLSALIAYERVLIICSTVRMNATRWRSIYILLISTCFILPSSTLMLIYGCEWGVVHKNFKSRFTSALVYTIGGVAGILYVLSTILLLKNFTKRMADMTTEPKSKTRICLRFSRDHLFILIPPIFFFFCVVPYQIWYSINRSERPYLHCGISFLEYIFKIIVRQLRLSPTAFTWLIFIYPSKVYMTEFYGRRKKRNTRMEV